MPSEPIGAEAIKAALVYLVSVLVSFGVPISDQQQLAVIGGAPFLALMWVWYQARKSTVPVDKANDHIEAALAIPATTKSEGFLFKKGS